MPRFVIQKHTLNNDFHYDFMLEWDTILKTWQISSYPFLDQMAVTQIQDHRLIYLDYEGVISGNRGNVYIFDHGEYQLISESSDFIEMRISGQILKGTVILRHLSDQSWQWVHIR